MSETTTTEVTQSEKQTYRQSSLKTTISGWIAGIAALLLPIALAPPELQNQIPQLFPEAWRGNIAIMLAIIAFLARGYQSHQTQDKNKVVIVKETTTTPDATNP